MLFPKRHSYFPNNTVFDKGFALETIRPPSCARRLRPERSRFSPSGKPIGAVPQTPTYVCLRAHNFDKGFGDIAAAAWHGGIWARHRFQRQSLYRNFT